MGQHLTLVDVRQAIVDHIIELLEATLARKPRVGAGALKAAKPKASTGPSAPAGRTPCAAALPAAQASIGAVNE
jgi:hypothetical protein